MVVASFFLSASLANAKNDGVEAVEFISHDNRLSGSLVFPASGAAHAAVVFVHGSGEQKKKYLLGSAICI